MPAKDLEIAEKFWKHTKTNIQNGNYDNFWKMKDHKISQALYIKDGNSVRVLDGAGRDRYIASHFNR